MSSCLSSSDLQFVNGFVNIQSAVIQCIENMNSPLFFPGYFIDGVFNLTNQILLNNLISVDEVTSTVTFDMFYRIYWTDPRMSMPAFWSAVSNKIYSNGIDILQLVSSQDTNGTQASIWLPDNFFPDSISTNLGESYLVLKPFGSLLYSRHVTVALAQSNFNYKTYPQDSHQIIMRFISYAYVNTLLLQKFTNPGIIFFDNLNGVPSFSVNPIWSLGQTSTEITVLSGVKSEGVAFITITRNPAGIVTRLALPMFLLIILAALTFWAPVENRFDATVTKLLAISALYIVVFQNIPMVGYLTTFDLFSIDMFIVLFLCCFLHQSIARIVNKIEQWPARILTARIVEAIGRIIIIPLVTMIYLISFHPAYSNKAIGSLIAVLSIYVIAFIPKEVSGVMSKYKKIMQLIHDKCEDLGEVGLIEILLFNWKFYRIVSSSLKHHYRSKISTRPSNMIDGSNIYKNNNDVKLFNNEINPLHS